MRPIRGNARVAFTGLRSGEPAPFCLNLSKFVLMGKVKLNTRSGYMLIQPLDVVYCEADGNYTHIQLSSGNRELTTQNLGSIEGLLKAGAFFRVSRSYLVNLKYLARVDRKNSLCILEYNGDTYSVKIPAQKIRLLEANFS